MASSGQKRSARPIFAGLGDFVLIHRDEILKSWIAMIDKHPNISASDNLTYTQLLDHLPELCAELAVLLKQPNAKEIKREAKRDAQAHGWKRWRQGSKLVVFCCSPISMADAPRIPCTFTKSDHPKITAASIFL